MTVFKKYFGVLIVAALALACNKGSDEPINTGPTASLNVINAVTDIRAISFYLNGTRQNINSAIFFNNSSGYFTVPAAEQMYQIKEDTNNVRNPIANITLALPKKDTNYSLLVTGQKSGNNIATILLDDGYTDTLNRTARIRFVQGSPGNTAYDVYVGDTISFKNQAFKAVSNFANIGPGPKVIRIARAGSPTPIITANVLLTVGTYYTLFTQGLSSGTGTNQFSAVLLETK